MLNRSRLIVLVTLASLLACGAPLSTTDRLSDDVAAADPSEGTDGAWLARVQRHLAEREYRASENDAGLQAPNRRHNLRTYFDATGARVVDRTAGGGPALTELRLMGLGRGDALAPVEPGVVTHVENRVEIERPGLREWFINGEAGLEQGFTLDEAPGGKGNLALELSVAPARAAYRRDGVVLTTPSGRVLDYGKLAVFDATGTSIPAEFVVASSDRIRLLVSDAGARYPLTIDPILTGTYDTLLEGQGANVFGYAVDAAGDVNGDGFGDVIVGDSDFDSGEVEEGAAFLFLGSSSGVADANYLTAATQLESNQAGAFMGDSVAAAGDVNGDGYDDVIVGARLYDAGQTDEGAAFVFLGSVSGIADGNPSTAATQLESDQTDSNFGRALSSAGDVNGDGFDDVIVGAFLYDAGELDEGAAFIFHGSASGIADATPATAATQFEPNSAGAWMGVAVAGAGDVNGDGYGDVIVNLWSGPALYNLFVYHGGPSGIPDSDLTSAATEIDFPTRSVDAAGDVNGDGYADVVVGTAFVVTFPPDPLEASTDAYVFYGTATGIAGGGSVIVTPASADPIEGGWSVAGAGDVNGDGFADVISSDPSSDLGAIDGGVVYVHYGSAAGIVTTAGATIAPVQSQTYLGGSYGLIGLNILYRSTRSIAGAGDVNGDGFADIIAGSGETGEAYIYHGAAAGIVDGDPVTASAELESDQTGVFLGRRVAGAGDVNGDGYADVIVGTHLYDAGEIDEGAAFIFLGSDAGIASGSGWSDAATQLESDQASAWFGRSVASAGDVNGDGYADVIVGADHYDAGEGNEGAAFIFLGSALGIADGNPATAATQLESDQVNAFLGYSASGAGDVNGDGFGDVIVGAYAYNGAGETDEGAAFVFLGGASGITDGDPTSASAKLESNESYAWLGLSVAGAGDVNGDGYADVIVGAPYYDGGASNSGSAFVFLGSASGVSNGNPTTAATHMDSLVTDGLLGWSVAGAGDVNADSYADVIVGGPSISFGQAQEGVAGVYLGSSSGIADAASFSAAPTRLDSNQTDANFGISVSGAGDVNGDGYADVIVGADHYDAGESNEGAAFVFLGSATGVPDSGPTTASGRLESNQVDAEIGHSVAGAGDVNGDGYADVLAGAPHYNSGQVDEGAAFVFLGNGNLNGRSTLARQRDGLSGDTVEPWGVSEGGGFEAEITATHPQGRGRVKAEFETCALGTAFGDVSCTTLTSPSWTEIIPPPPARGDAGGLPNVILSETFTGLTDGTLYHWRARVLHARSSVTEVGITAPPNPAHGPWRRISGHGSEADIRVVPEPGAMLSLASGLALLGLLNRRRRAKC